MESPKRSIVDHRWGCFGWSDERALEFTELAREGSFPGRILRQQHGKFQLVCPEGEMEAGVRGRLRREGTYPVVGDWVAVSPSTGGGGVIEQVLSRSSLILRKIPGRRSREQAIAANVDTIFIMMSLNRDYDLRRLERYLILAWDSGAHPVIVLSKADLCPDPAHQIAQVEEVALGIPVTALSSLTGQGLYSLDSYLEKRKTVAFLGSSGVGKSTLINRLLGEDVIPTQEIRPGDDRGRHTTTHRELFLLPSGGVLLDTPGLREIQFVDAEAGFDATFGDIEELAGQCRYRDCRHQAEPDCAVQEAVTDGRLDRDRYRNYLKIRKELEFQTRRLDLSASLQEKKKRKEMNKALRKIVQEKRER